jgi:hypothetical protein
VLHGLCRLQFKTAGEIMKIQSGHFLERGFQIACCLLLISGFYAVSPIVYADKIKDFIEQWQIDKKWISAIRF